MVFQNKPTRFGVKSPSTRSEGTSATNGGGYQKDPTSIPAFKDYGKHVFSGKIADQYLKKQGASGAILKDSSWVRTHADVVAAAVLDW
jgi:hypothetical protein